MIKDRNESGQDYQSYLCTDYCNVSACVRQNKGIHNSADAYYYNQLQPNITTLLQPNITTLQMPTTTTNFLPLKHD